MSVLDTAEYRRLALIAAGVDPSLIPCILDTATWRRLMLAALYDLSQGGGGSPGYVNGSVQFYADLPVTVGTPPVNTAYLVREDSGVWFINRKPAGIYVRLFNNGTLADWDYAGEFPAVNDSQYFRIYDTADPTREVAFNVSGVAAATTRTLTVPNANGTIALTSDIPPAFNPASPGPIGNVTPAAGTFTNLVANTELQLPSAAAPSPSAGDIYRVTDTIRYRDSGNTERLLLNATDNLANLANTATARTNLGLGSADNVTFGSIQNTPIGSTTRNTIAATTLNANNGTITSSAPVLDLSQTWNNAAVTFTGLKFNVTATAAASNSMFADIQAGGYSQFAITRISSTSNAVWVYNTNSGTNTNGVGANYERGFVRWSSNIFQIGNEAAGTGSARHCAIVAGSNSYMFYNNGEAVSPLSWVANNSGALRFDTRARIASPADSVLRLTNNAATDFDRLQFGGTTSSFPALKRSSTALQVRLADDSAYSVLDAQLRAQGTAPATSGATGTAGDIRYDADYIYVCTAANTWKRASIATW